LPSWLVIVMIPLWMVVSCLVGIGVLTAVVSMPTNSSSRSVYSSPELVSGVVALAALVFNLSKLFDAAKSDKKDLFHIYMLFTSATAFFTLFLFVYPAYANMTDPHGFAKWLPLVAVDMSLAFACLSLVGAILWLAYFVLTQWRDTRGADMQPAGSETVEDDGQGGKEVSKPSKRKRKDAPFHSLLGSDTPPLAANELE
jgi:hypothetical protein